ncbi:hypothetical protein [Clostridium sp.]|uniref:hypothetical protein n=1 Tax=Clostridium sp. TaxID=1506 RepID=UPI003463AC08
MKIKKIIKSYKFSTIILSLICVFLIYSLINMKYRENVLIFKNLNYGLDSIHYILEDYHKKINNDNDVDSKIDTVKRTILKIDFCSESLDYGIINKKFNRPIEGFVSKLIAIDSDKLKENHDYLNEVLEFLNEAYFVSSKIHEISLEDFYKDKMLDIFRLELSDEITNYLNEINSLKM